MQHRKIRSFVRREGRITKSQQAALDKLLPLYSIEVKNEEKLDFGALFERDAKIAIEIGFGMGDSLIKMAQNYPDINFIGIEVHRPGIGAILNNIHAHKLSNLKIITHDAVEVLRNHIEHQSIDYLQIFFPDPWPKKKHHKRRLINNEFLAIVKDILKPTGYLHIATDWENYAESILELMQDSSHFQCQSNSAELDYEILCRPNTKFERRGLNLGHGVWDILCRCK
jgi:tRNA (guanine-N7-)-methyltransferase